MSNARNLARLLPNSSGQLPYGALDSSVTPKFGMKNLLINGDFRVWLKGTSGAWSGNGIQSADRWTHSYVDFTPAQSKQEDSINGETVDCLQLLKNGGTYTGGEISQKVETATSKYLRGQTVTFSFWIKKVGATIGSHNFDCWIGDSETVDDTGWTNSRTLDRGRATRQTGITQGVAFTNNNWQKIVITRTLSSDTNTIYCTIYTGNTPNGEGIRIAKAQLEVGSIATDFEKRPLALENEMCRRFQQDAIRTVAQFYAPNDGTYARVISYTLSPQMRATPTVSIPDMGEFTSIATMNRLGNTDKVVCIEGNVGSTGNYGFTNWTIFNAEF